MGWDKMEGGNGMEGGDGRGGMEGGNGEPVLRRPFQSRIARGEGARDQGRVPDLYTRSSHGVACWRWLRQQGVGAGNCGGQKGGGGGVREQKQDTISEQLVPVAGVHAEDG